MLAELYEPLMVTNRSAVEDIVQLLLTLEHLRSGDWASSRSSEVHELGHEACCYVSCSAVCFSELSAPVGP